MEEVYSSEALLNQLCEHQPEAISWFVPVYESEAKEKIIDFEVRYCNIACCRKNGLPKEQILGQRILRDGFPDPTISKLKFDQCLRALLTGEPVHYSYFSSYFDRYFSLSRVKVQNGILVTSRDLTDLYLAEQERNNLLQEKQQQLTEYTNILNTCSDGIITLKSIRDEKGSIVDFRIMQCNAAAVRLGRLPEDAAGKRLLEVLPQLSGTSYFEIQKQVVETGLPFSAELSFNPDSSAEAWQIVSLTKLDDGLVANFVDITRMRQAEHKAIEQAHELDTVFQTSLNGMYLGEAIRDEEGRITDLRFLRVNQKFLTMFGFSEEQLLNTTLFTLSPITKETGYLDALTDVLENGSSRQETLYYERLHQWYEFSMVRLDENKVSVTFADVTPLRQKSALLDNILLHSAAGISYGEVIRNAEGRIVDGRPLLANDAAIRLTGIPRELYFSRTSVQLEPNILQSAFFQKIIHTMETGEPSTARYQVETSGKWIELTLSRMDRDHLIIVFNDISESMEAQEKQERLLEELRRSNTALQEFTRAASHDLKEPIRKIVFFSGKLKVLLAEKLTEAESQLLERVEKSAERMKLLIEDLLEYSFVEQNGREKEEIDLNQKLAVILADLELLISEKNALVKVGKLPVIHGYRRQVQQLFQNLLSNALKYQLPGVQPEITISAHRVTGKNSGLNLPEHQQEQAFHLIKIKDNGIGFAQADAERIFDMFTRLHGNGEYSGSGIGLAIVRKVVENHGGYIRAEGEPGKGACFFVVLPAG